MQLAAAALRWGGRPFLLARSYATAGVVDFVQWCVDNDEDADDDEQLDGLVVAYIQDLYEENFGRSKAESTLYGILLYLPSMKGKFPRSQQALRGWSRLTPSTSYPPFSWVLACAVGAKLARSRGEYRHGVGTLLAFDCFLRVGELCALTREDVADDGDRRMGAEHRGMLLRIRKAKTGKNQTVRVFNPEVRLVVRRLVRATLPGHCLFPFSPAVFRGSAAFMC